MKKVGRFAGGLGLAGLTAALAVLSGLARRAFFEIYAFVKGDGLVAPNVFRIPPTGSPYEKWLQRAKTEMPFYEGLVLQDVAQAELHPWPQLGEGINGLYLRFADYQMTDGRLIELPQGGLTRKQRQMYEMGIYILSGRGHTTLQQENEPVQTVEWDVGDLFSVPLNVSHQHFNSGEQPARMLIVSSFPLVLNIMNNQEFIQDNAFRFTDRYDGDPEFVVQGEDLRKFEASTNFVDDVLTAPTVSNPGAGNGRQVMHWLMAGNSMLRMHVSELAPQSHLKAHRHSSDAFILLLSGEGFSVTWPEGRYGGRVRVDWKAGTLFVPPTYWYHQHFNPGSESARHLAINVPEVVRHLGLNFNDQLEVDRKELAAEWKRALRQVSGRK